MKKHALAMSLMAIIGVLASVLLADDAPNPSGQHSKPEMIGSWSITWDADLKNVNPIRITKSDKAFEGTYINDNRETCKVSGKLDRDKQTVTFTIRGPGEQFHIECEGQIANGKRVDGRYSAYGTTKGSFRMAKNED